MTRFSVALAATLAAASLVSAIPQAAQAQSASSAAAEGERAHLYFVTYGVITDLLKAETAYEVARAHDDKHAMQIAAAEMLGASTKAAELAAVLNLEVQAEGTHEKAKLLAPQLAEATLQIENKLDGVVVKGELTALNKLLDSDETASALTELHTLNKQVLDLIER